MEDTRNTSHGGSTHFVAGARFDRYHIVRVLGHGGMGDVYEAIHEGLGKRVALKILRAELMRDRERRVRFLQEARTAALAHHPHIVDVYDAGTEDGFPFLVMEYLDGEDLASLLRREGPLEVERALEILLPVAAALSALHEQGIIHRDIKPSNIFVACTSDGVLHPKLLDFGISKVVLDDQRTPLTATQALLGTPKYMAPEQVRGTGEHTAKSDQYSLGAVLYECVTGRPPFVHESFYDLLQAIVAGNPEPPGRHATRVNPEMEAVILRALARDPADRFDSVRELARALMPCASARARAVWASALALDDGAPMAPAVARQRATRRHRRAPVLVAAVSLVCVLAGLSWWAWLGRDSRPERQSSVQFLPAAENSMASRFESRYRLKTQLHGDIRCLEGNELSSPVLAGAAFLDLCQEAGPDHGATGQLWTIEPAYDGHVRLKNLFHGAAMCLESHSQAHASRHEDVASMHACRDSDSQLWQITADDTGHHHVTTRVMAGRRMCFADSRAIDRYGGPVTFRPCEDTEAQRWRLEKQAMPLPD